MEILFLLGWMDFFKLVNCDLIHAFLMAKNWKGKSANSLPKENGKNL